MTTLGFFPKGKFAEVSITGRKCELNCPMCGGRWLEGMMSAENPEELLKLGRKLWRKGVRGLLISGGFTKEGKLPFIPFIWAIRELKKMGFLMSIHTGPLERREAEVLSKTGIDLVDYDLILEESPIRVARGLAMTPDDFVEGMENLMRESIEVVPHITVGLPGSEGRIDLYAEVLREMRVRRAVLLGFIPTTGTRLSEELPPSPEELRVAAEKLSRTSKLSLGCMRAPWLKRDYDINLLGLVDRVANPHPSLDLKRIMACCSIPEELLQVFKD